MPSPGVPDHHPIFAVARDAEVPVLSRVRPRDALGRPPARRDHRDRRQDHRDRAGPPRCSRRGGRHAVAVGNTELPLRRRHRGSHGRRSSSWRRRRSGSCTPTASRLTSARGSTWRRTTSTPVASAATPAWPTTSPPRRASGRTSPPTRWPSATRTTRRRRRAAPGSRPARSPSASARPQTTASRATASCSTRATRSPRCLSCTAPSRTTSPTRSPPRRPRCTPEGPSQAARTALLAFRGLPHRVSLVGEAGGVRWFDDSKATAPHATRAAVRAFPSVVLIAGGRNKGLDLTELAEESDAHPGRRRHRRVRTGRRGGVRRSSARSASRRRWTTPWRRPPRSPRRGRRAPVACLRLVRLVLRPTASGATTSCERWTSSSPKPGRDEPPIAAARHAHRRRLGLAAPSPHGPPRRRTASLEDLRGTARDHRHAEPARARDGALGVARWSPSTTTARPGTS